MLIITDESGILVPLTVVNFSDTGTDPGPFTPDVVPGTATVTGATNVANSVISTSAAHGFWPGMGVLLSGVAGNTAVNGNHKITTVPTATSFAIDQAGNGTYSGSGGQVSPVATARYTKVTMDAGIGERDYVFGKISQSVTPSGASSGAAFF